MTNKKHSILVVEDEDAIRTGLVDVLVYHGYAVEEAIDGREGLEKSSKGNYDLILLDVMLPYLDGFEICRQIREQDREQAVIMLTARASDDDIINGLKLGADDYVSKPFSVAQLVLRIQAVLRRSRPEIEENGIIYLGRSEHADEKLVIDVKSLSGDRQGEMIAFTRKEMDILQYLYVNHDRPISREELLSKVWGYAKDLDLETRTVDIHIAKLRRKIEINPSAPEFLVTVRGAGYKLVAG